MKELILLLYTPKYVKCKSKQIKAVMVMHYLDALKFKPKEREMPKLISSIVLLLQIMGPPCTMQESLSIGPTVRDD